MSPPGGKALAIASKGLTPAPSWPTTVVTSLRRTGGQYRNGARK